MLGLETASVDVGTRWVSALFVGNVGVMRVLSMVLADVRAKRMSAVFW